MTTSFLSRMPGSARPTGAVARSRRGGVWHDPDASGTGVPSAALDRLKGLAARSPAVARVQLLQRLADQSARALPGKGVVQRAPVKVSGGVFKDDQYEPYKDGSTTVGLGGAAAAATSVGASMGKLSFTPSPDLDAQEVHLVQIVRERRGAAPVDPGERQGNLGFGERQVPKGDHAGWGIDAETHAPASLGLFRIGEARKGHPEAYDKLVDDLYHKRRSDQPAVPLTSRDPRYAQQRLSAATPAYAPSSPPTTGHTGYAAVRAGGETVVTKQTAKGFEKVKLQDAHGAPLLKWVPPAAVLRDQPAAPIASNLLGMEFEVTALATGGAMNDKYLGSVSWGWTRAVGGREAKLLPLSLVSMGDPSAAFAAAAEHWNALTVEGAPLMPLPVPDHTD
ncbi:hypothetical protein [Paracoccus marinaquae]|uniref:Uncharacterized protein n=1 Tax=Paracoccus marinaquae TaxID=2841926 RepID=A0ABS6AGM1_9RHOB|nr:hypothetical protein [Paracoccus marinaquae]MBU3028521.1 hypothetical protein [Paracoccus marinaquae]